MQYKSEFTFCIQIADERITSRILFDKMFLSVAEYGKNQSSVQWNRNYDYIQNHYQAEERPLLVDVTEEFLVGGKTGKRLKTTKNTPHSVLWYNIPNWISMKTINSCRQTCDFRNCVYISDINKIRKSSAAIFCITTKGIGKYPPLRSSERPVDQAWIFFGLEPPVYLEKNYKTMRRSWENSFNLSMSYRMDSDIVFPPGNLKHTKRITQRNYIEIFKNKTKFAAWVVSNCHTLSRREEFVNKMKMHGLKIDIYGRCGTTLLTDPKEMISKQYKFYLSFENSLCSDYVTEKVFGYLSLNTV